MTFLVTAIILILLYFVIKKAVFDAIINAHRFIEYEKYKNHKKNDGTQIKTKECERCKTHIDIDFVKCPSCNLLF